MTGDDVQELVKLALAEKYKVQGFVNTVVEAYGPMLHGLIQRVAISTIDIKADQVFHLINRGFTRDDAIDLVNSDWAAVVRSIQSMGAKGVSSGK